jgi:hypothetical protein
VPTVGPPKTGPLGGCHDAVAQRAPISDREKGRHGPGDRPAVLTRSLGRWGERWLEIQELPSVNSGVLISSNFYNPLIYSNFLLISV